MDAILLCMKKRGIRFFRKIRFENTEVTRFYEKYNFLRLLRKRYAEYDNILIMAHGANHAILTTTANLHKPFIPYIGIDDADVMRNDFVFAVSCFTANEFGKACIDKGCIAYLGYQVEIGSLFAADPGPKSNVPRSVSTAVNTIIKHIFVSELSKSYEEFLRTPISVRILKERFSFSLEKRLAELINMSPEQIHRQYGVSISARHYASYAVNIILQVLSILDEVQHRLICLGDENYISASYIKYRKQSGASLSEISEELESNTHFKEIKHGEYKCYLRTLACGQRKDLQWQEKSNASSI